MEDIKKIHPALLSIISIVVFAISFLGAPYIFAESAFDFSLANSDDKSVVQGGKVTNIITTTLKSGTPTPVSFSVSGLPPNSSASFSSVSCTPTCTPTITISTDASTPAGVYPITVVGTPNAPVPTPGSSFPNQTVTALGYCSGSLKVSFYGTININNQYSNDVVFTRTNINKIGTEVAPTNFTVPANTIKAVGGFGSIDFSSCLDAVPSTSVYGQGTGSATYSVSVGGTVIYSWNYAI